ncbi:MAG: cytochrome c1 [Pseudomonadota bacterium]
MLRRFTIATLATLGLALLPSAHAAGGKVKEYRHMHASWEGVFGHYEKDQLQRGYQVYRAVCATCHSLSLVAFRHLGDKGGPYYLESCPKGIGIPDNVDCSDPAQNPIIKSLAADFTITDGPDDAGDMFTRPGLPSDYIPSPYANRQQAMAVNGGAYPPDMSLLTKARHHGTAYMYSLLTGYVDPPEILNVEGAQYYNPYYPGDTKSLVKPEYLDEDGNLLDGLELPYGGVFKMKAPLTDGIVAYEDGTPETVDQYAQDVTAFLQWAAEPKLEERKAMGRFVILYLFIFAGIVYASYRQIWRNVQ